MSNVIYDDKMYNEDIKQEFMENYGEGTKKILARIFKISRPIEEDLGKDLYDFNREELRRLFFLFGAKTAYSSKANVTWVHKYLEHCENEGLLECINPLDNVSKEWKEQFVVKSIKRFWTDEEIKEIMKSRVNDNDAVILGLLFFAGARGQGNSEITNLKREDILENTNELRLSDSNGKERIVKVDQDIIKLCIRASLDLEYEKLNGNPDEKTKSRTAAMVDNSFVVKSALTRTLHLNEAEKNVVHRRLANIAKELDEPAFSPMNLVYSGMLAMMKDIYVTNNGNFSDDDYETIFNQFGEESEQSKSRIKSEFLNKETLLETYPDL